jgi:SdpC family antimicrobial peptide
LLCVSVVFGIVLVTGCTGSDETGETDGDDDQVEYSGVQLFRGLVLAQGEIAKEVEPIREHWMVSNYIEDTEKLTAYRQFSEKIVNQIQTTRPDYFPEFKAAVTSGDRVDIREALIRGSLVAGEAVSQLEEVEELRARFREDPDLVQSYLENLRESGAEDQTVEHTERLLTAFGTGELGPELMDRIPERGAATAVVVAGYVAVAAVAVVAVATVAVAAGSPIDMGTVTTRVVDIDVNVDFAFNRIIPGRFREEPSLLQEQLVDATARRFEI